ncbi:hypothetical protein [Pontibacter cellulosilyticus]|uniref:Cytochrome C and Quinol oxidase polypeptide I n=1 Tax=Pontibacter cellulosilyticus TaxID=1720253 RepID=A0A923N847_9BACT|nr:hypothetical protein [Pontibacter cellulosilyticus]MBC5994513.1 hypothetical protein [Pontibacter cellulosilyticus]
MNIHSKRNWLLVSLLNLVIVAILGLLLRWMFVAPVAGINYKYLLHAHSHVALLGWLYAAVFVALVSTFLPAELRDKKTYTWQFWLSQGAVLGMLFTFPVQGYAAASIAFSTAHILLSYWFAYRFQKDAKAAKLNQGKHQLSFKFIRAALFFLVLSSLGPWAMGPFMALGHSGSELYFNAIYFYLHFQYNGWFTFAVLGLLFWLLEHYQIAFNAKNGGLFFRLMFWACIPAFLLSVLWIKPAIAVYWISGAAAVVQVMALGVLLAILIPLRRQVYNLFGGWSKLTLQLAILAFILKTGMQFATAFPYMADLAYKIRLFVIGYLHLVLIGFVSLFILAFFVQKGWLSLKQSMSKWGIGIFILGFILTEMLLFLQGTFFWIGLGAIPYFNELLFGQSILLPFGIMLFTIPQLKSINPETKIIFQLQKQG